MEGLKQSLKTVEQQVKQMIKEDEAMEKSYKLLHKGAISAITYHPEFKGSYQCKLKEGKHEQSVINAVGSKVVLSAAAAINNQKKQVNKYKKAA